MPHTRAETPWHAWLKAIVYVLLASNTAVYGVSGTLNEALDSVAWLILLASFEFETRPGSGPARRSSAALLRGVRLAAAATILGAAAGYVRDGEWLDVFNTGLWIAVVALLEFEVRYAGAVARHRPWFLAATAALFAGLGALAFTWLWRGEWFDAYDAALWLVAFATIEMNVLAAAQRAAVDVGPV